ncbi:hypothetical protein M2459_001840 [Parabacteroides sp. PF5-5]|uniref:DUF3843 family protein n=1 Tax=unclassified Parabacteroides TaxID=2649774 RepID=UPI002473C112|nr:MULTISPECIES: DUF3843 family protein [unclassified Parabacteroides]MDH6305387.1 hypothetical protein [Parabacteroides sp. PH5-39]MDH6316097.1 hypothetical protein [Parabacteroides sp. PF5-13]MDH6320247.1 hypothetical protein [Parabacteroides sp. PH5-13]MDH6323977.1 hypothetical protein [Parabacteroides sp. PH5-8]MDH6327288.1 hypothetical protein [Parabacteroides sp. PH5-41]
MKQHVISLQEWIQYQPYRVIEDDDQYFTLIASEIYSILDISKIGEALDYSSKDLRTISCCITNWYICVISNIWIWQSFKDECRKLYGRPLPFYEVSKKYSENEVNYEDICFLLWFYMQQLNPNRLINPINPGIEMIADQITEALSEDFILAPENERINMFLFPEKETMRFSEYKGILDWFHYKSYLNIFNIKELDEQTADIHKSRKNESEKHMLTVATRLELCLKSPNRMMALTSPEWMARFIPKHHPLHALYNNVKLRDHTYYLFKRLDEMYIYVSDIATEEEFAVKKESIDKKTVANLTADDSVFMMLLICFDEEWWQCGRLSMYSINNMPEEKPSDDKEKEKAYNDFIAASKGKEFLYFSSQKDLYAFLRKEMNYSLIDNSQVPDNIGNKLLLTATPKEGLIFLEKGIECIKDPDNPFYDRKVADREAMSFIVIPDFCPFEIVCKLIDKNMLPDALFNNLGNKKAARKFMADNIDFCLRYFLNKHR